MRDEIEFTQEESNLFFVLIGERPPSALYNLAFESNELFQQFGEHISELRHLITDSLTEVRGALPEGVVDEYVQAMSILTGTAGGMDYLGQFAHQLSEIAGGQILQSQQIMQGKIEMIFELALLLIHLAFMAALAYFTGGLSLGQMALARARTRFALLTIMYQFLHRTHLLPGISEAIEEALVNFASQLTMLGANRGKRRPRGINWKDVGTSALFGYITGTFISGIGGIGDRFKGLFKDRVDSKVLRTFSSSTWNAGAEGFGEGLGETVTSGLLYGKWGFNFTTVGGGAVSSLTTDPLFKGGHDLGMWAHKFNAVGLGAGAYNSTSRAGQDIPHGTGDTPGVDPDVTSGPGPVGAGPTPLPNLALFAPTTFTDGGSTSGGTTVGGETPVNRTGSTLPHSQSPIAPPTDRRPYDTEPQPAADHIVTSRTELDRAPDIGTTPLTPGDSLHGGDGRLTAPSDGDPGEVAPYPHGGTRRESSGFGTVGAASSGSRTGLPSDDVLSRDEGVEFGGDDARPSTAGAPPRSGSPVSPESLGRTPQPSGPEARLRQNPQELYDGSLHETDPEAAPTGVQDPAPAVTDANASPETPSEPGSHLPTAAASPTPTPSSTTPHPATPPSSATTGATGGRTLVHPVGEGEATDPTAASEPQARTSPLRVEAGTLPVPHQTPARAETAFDWRTFEFDGQSFADVTVDVEFINESSLPQADVDAVWGRIEEGIQREVNAHGHVLPEFGQLRVTVQPAAPGSVPHLRVELVGPDSGRQMSPFVWRTDATPEDFAQQIGDLLGLWDDATASADPAPTDTAASVDPVPVSTGTVPGALSAPAPPGSPRPSSLGPSAGFLADTEAHALETSEEQPIRVSTQSNDPAGASIAPSEPQPVPAVSSVPRAAAPVVTVSDPSPTNTETAPVTAAAQAPPGDPVPRSNDTESLPSTVSRTHTFVAPSMDAVPYGAWAHRRATAPVATVRTAPQAGPDSRATGRRTGPAPGTSTKVRRIEAGFGRWVRDLTVALPVTFGTGTHPGDLGILQQRITRLLGDHINTGFVLPGSQDQLHVGVELIESSAEAGAVELTRASEPGGSDQPRLQLRAAQDDQDMLRDDSMLLHEILRHVGVTNRYRDTTALFRSPSEEVDATSRRLPGSYLTQIETATDVGRVLPDAPLPVTAESSDAFGQPSAPVPAPATGAAGVSRVDRLDSVRPYGTNPGQLQRPSPEDQHRLESVFPRDRRGFQRFPDPRGNTFRLAGPIRALNRVRRRNSFATDMGSADWVQRINGRWQDSAPRSASRQRLPNVPRLANCIDVARSVLLSWHGHPTVAAAVVQPPDSVAVETNGPPRTSEWLGTRWRHHDHRSDAPGSASQQAWSAVAERLQAHGHGSSAIVVFRPGRTIHAVNAVNYGGRIYWIDAQRGRVSPDPLYTGESFMSIELDPHFNPIDPLPVLQRFTGRPAETAPASYADLQWAAALEQTAHGSPDQENALEPLPDTHGAQDTQIVENWLSESALRRVRRSAALRVVDASVREWMATGRDRSADGADETSRRQLAAIQRSIADWKAAKSGRSARMSAVDRLLAQVTSLLDGIAGRPADAVEQQRESLPPRTLDRPAPQTFAGPPVPVVNVPSDAPLVSGTYHRDSSLITLADQGRGGPGLRTAPQTAQFIRRNTTWNAGDPAVLNAAGTGEPGPSGEPSFAAQVAFHLSGPVYAPATDGEWLRHDPTAADQIPPTPAMVTGTDPEPPADVPDTPGSRTSAADGAGRAGAADPSALTTHATGAQGSVWRLPPYLERMDSAGLATLHELDSSGLDWITTMIESATGPGSAGQIRDDLANQPSAFIGRGRAYQVVGSNGWFDVVVSLRADSGRARPTVTLPTTENDGSEWGPRSWAEITSGAANVSVSGRTRGLVVRGTGTVLAPTPTPGVLAGASVNVNAGYGIRTVKDARAAQVAEADRVVSAQGTIDVARRMRWHLRIARAGQGPARHFWGQTEGTLRVPVADLVPLDAPRPESRAVTPDESRRIALSPSMSVVAADSGHLYQGGGGLLDAIASQLHPSLIGAGAPGRTEVLQAATSQALSHALRRMLTGWVTSPDLASSDGKVAGSFRVTAEITAVSPVPGAVPDPGATGDGSGETAADGTFSPGSTLKPRQKAVTAHSTTLGRSSNVVAMGGPGVGAGVMEGGPLARVFVQPGGEWSRSRFVRTSRALALKQGVDVGGDNVLYAADVLVHVQATGPTPPAQRAGRSARSGPARARVWFRLSLVEAAELDLPLPAGVTKPARLFANPGFERMMPAGPAGASVSLTGLDSGRLQASIEETFRKDPRLAGILPSWGHRELDEQRNWRVSDADQARMRHNSRALTDTLSPANLQTHKAQLLTTGVFVRLVRKRWDVTQTVQVRVTGRIIPDTVRHLGDRADRDLVVSAALAEGAASGQSTETGGVLIARGNAKPVPGHLYLTGFGGYISTAERANRAGPKFAAGFESEGMSPAAHWDGTIEFDVEITSVERQRTLHRSLLPGTPGRHQPQVRTIARSRRPEPGTPGPAVPSAGDSVTPMALVSETVRFTSPAGFTLRQPVQLPASTKPQPIDVPFALGISSLLDPAWRASAATAVPEWLLLESTHSGADVLEMARDLLARAATHADSALSTAGLDPALKIEDTFNPEATGMGLRIGTGQVWIVDNLRFPRRLNSLHGAVGAQFHVVAPRVVAVVDAPPVETFVSGGHVASSERASARGWVGGLLVQGAGDLAPDHWAIAGPGYMRVGVKAKERSAKTSGSVTRVAVSAPGGPAVLVSADLEVLMVAEVSTGHNPPRVETDGQRLRGAVLAWLTEDQARRLGLGEQLDEHLAKAAGPASGVASVDATTTPETAWPESTSAPAHRADESAPSEPTPNRFLHDSGPLGLGHIDHLPAFDRLLPALRQELDRLRGPDFRRNLLPDVLIQDRFRNTQRLMQVLGSIGSRSLLTGAMDGGVAVPLHARDGSVAYVARFTVTRSAGRFTGPATGRRMMMHVTGAGAETATAEVRVSQSAPLLFGLPMERLDAQHEGPRGAASGNEFSVLGSAGLDASERGREESGGVIVGTPHDAPAAEIVFLIEAAIELYSPGRPGEAPPVATVQLPAPAAGEDDRYLRFRMPHSDLNSLARIGPAREPSGSVWQPVALSEQLARWRQSGTAIPEEAQVNNFQGAPVVRAALADLVRGLGAMPAFTRAGEPASWVLEEALATEWLISALPQLAATGAQLPEAYVPHWLGGDDLRVTADARFTQGQVLGVGERMLFEFTAAPETAFRREGDDGPSHDGAQGQVLGVGERMLFEFTAAPETAFRREGDDGPSHDGADGLARWGGTERTDAVRSTESNALHVGGGWMRFRRDDLLQALVTPGIVAEDSSQAVSTAMTDVARVKQAILPSVLVQFTVDLRLTATLRRRARHYLGADDTSGTVEAPLPHPVVVRMSLPSAQRLLSQGRITDRDGRLPAPAQRADWHAEILLQEITDTEGEPIGVASFSTRAWAEREAGLRHLAKVKHYTEWRRDSGDRASRERPMPFPHRSRYFFAGDTTADGMQVVLNDGAERPLAPGDLTAIARTRTRLAKLPMDAVIVLVPYGGGPPTTLPGVRSLAQMTADATGLTVMEPAWGMTVTSPDGASGGGIHLTEGPDGSPGRWRVFHPGSESRTLDSGHAEEERSAAGAVAVDSSADRVAPVSRGTDGFAYDRETSSGPVSDEGARSPGHQHAQVGGETGSGSPRVPELVSPSPNAVPADVWRHRRAGARVARLETSVFDPFTTFNWRQRRNDRETTGHEVFIRAEIQRIEAVRGHWVRALTVDLPVRLGTGMDDDRMEALQGRMTELLDKQLNVGFVLPVSGDQLHIDVRFRTAPEHPEAVHISMTNTPGRSNQHNFALHAGHNDAEIDRDNHVLLHEILHYVGVTDRYHAPLTVFRRRIEQTDSFGLMASLTDPLPTDPHEVRLPGSYLAQIETATSSGPVIYDHPLDAGTSQSRSAARITTDEQPSPPAAGDNTAVPSAAPPPAPQAMGDTATPPAPRSGDPADTQPGRSRPPVDELPDYADATLPRYSAEETDADALAARWGVPPELVQDLARYGWFDHGQVDALRLEVNVEPGEPTEHLLHWIDSIGRIPTDLGSLGDPYQWTAADVYEVAGFVNADPRDLVEIMAVDSEASVEASVQHWQDDLAGTADLLDKLYGGDVTAGRALTWLFAVGAYHRLSPFRLRHLVYLMRNADVDVTAMTSVHEVDVPALEEPAQRFLSQWPVPERIVYRLAGNRLLDPVALDALLTELHITRPAEAQNEAARATTEEARARAEETRKAALAAAQTALRWVNTIGRIPTGLSALGGPLNFDALTVYDLAQSVQADPQHLMQVLTAESSTAEPEPEPLRRRLESLRGRFQQSYGRRANASALAWLFAVGAHHRMTLGHMHDAVLLLHNAGITPSTVPQDVDVAALVAEANRLIEGWRVPRDTVYELARRRLLDVDALESLLSDLAIEAGDPARDLLAWIGTIGRIPTDLAELGAELGLDAVAVYRLAQSVNADPQSVMLVIARGPRRSVQQWLQSLRQTAAGLLTRSPNVVTAQPGWLFQFGAQHRLGLAELDDALALMRGTTPLSPVDSAGALELAARARLTARARDMMRAVASMSGPATPPSARVVQWAGEWSVNGDDLGRLTGYEWFDAEAVAALRSELHVEGGRRTDHLLVWLHFIGRVPTDLAALGEPLGLDAATVYELAQSVMADPGHVMRVIAGSSDRAPTEWMSSLQATVTLFRTLNRRASPVDHAWLFQLGAHHELSLDQLAEILPRLDRAGIRTGTPVDDRRVTAIVARVTSESDTPTPPDQPSPRPAAAPPAGPLIPPPSRAGEAQSSSARPEPQRGDVRTAGPEQIEAARDAREQPPAEEELPGYSRAGNHVHRHANRWRVPTDIVRTLARYEWFDADRVDSLRSELEVEGGGPTLRLLRWINTIGRIPADLPAMAQPSGITPATVYELAMTAGADPRHVLQIMAQGPERTVREWMLFLSATRDHFTRWYPQGPPAGLARLFEVGSQFGLSLSQINRALQEMHLSGISFFSAELRQLVAGLAGQSTHAPGFTDQAPRAAVPSVHAVTTPQPPAPDVPEQQSGSDGPLPGYSPASDQVYRHAVRWFVSPRLVSRLTRYGWFDPHAVDTLRSELAPGTRTRHLLSWIEVIGRVPVNLADLGRPLDIDANDVFLLAEVASADPLHLSQVLRTRLDQIYPGHWFGVLSDLSNDFTRLHGEAADRRGLAWLFALSAHHGLGLLQLYDLMFLMAEESVPLSVGFEDEEVMRLVAGVTERPLRRKPSPVAPAAVTSAFQAHVPVAGPSRRPAASPSGADLSSVEEGPSGLAPAAGDVGSASGEAGPVLDLSVLGGGPWVSSVEEATGRRADDHSAPTVPDTGPTVEPADNTLPTGRQPDAHTIAPTENRAVGAIAGPSRRNTTADGADLPAPTPDAPTPAYPPAGPEHSESAETPPSYSPGTPPDYFRADNDADVLATRWDVSADVVRPLAPYQWFVPEAVDALRTQLGISQGGPTESLLIWIDAIGRIPTDLATAGESRNMNAASLYTLAASAGADPQDVLQLMSTDPDQTNRQWAEQLAYARDLFIRTYGEAAASPREIAWFFGVGAYHGLSLNRLLQLVHLMDYAQTPTLTPFEDVDVRELENLIGILTYWRLPPDLIQRFIRHRLLHTAPLLHGLLTDLNIERGQAATDFVEWADTIGRTPTDLRDLAVRHSVDPANLYRLAQSANADPQHIMQIFASDPEMTAAQWDFFDARVYDIGIRFSERFPSRPSDPRDSAWLFRLGAHHGLTATRLYDVLPLLAQAGIAPGTPVEQVDVRALEADVAERYARWQEEWDGRRQREASARERIRRLQERWDLRWAEHVPEIYAGYHWFDTDAVDALLSDLGVERGQQATDFVSWIGYIDRVPTDLAALGAPVGLDAAAVYRLSYSVNSDPQHVTQVIARGPERTVPQWMESLRQTTEQYRTLYPHFWSESESWAFAVAAHYGLSLDQLNRMLPLLHEAGLGPDDDPDDEGIARLMARARGRRPAPDGPASESDVSSLDESRSVSPRLPAAAPPAPPLNLSSSGADGSDSGISPAVEGLVDLSSVAGGPTGVPSTFSVSAEVSGQLVGRDRDPDAGPLAGPSGGTPARPAAGSAQTGSYEALPGYTAANTDAVGAAGRWLVHPGFVRPLARYEWFDPEAVDVLRSVLGVAPGGPTAGLLQWIQAIGRIPTELLDPEQPLGLQARTLFDLSLTAGADPHYVLQVMARGPVVPVEQWRQLLQRARAEFQRHYATHRFGSEWLFAVGASHDLSLAQLRALIPVLRGTGFGPGTSVQDEDLRWLLDLQTGRQPAHLPAPAAPAAAVGGGEPGISRAVGEPVDLSSVEGGPAGISFTSPGSFDVSSGAGQPSGFAPASVEEGPSGLAPAAGDVGSASGEAGPVLDLSVLAGDPWIASVEEATGRRADDRPSAPTTSDTRPTMEPADNTPAGDDTPVTDQQPTTNTTGSTENAPAGPGGAPLRRRPAVRHRPGVGRRQQPPATSDAAAETTADTRTTPAPTVLDPVPARPSMPRRRAVPSGHVPAQPVGPAAGDAPQISSTSRRDGTGEPASDAPAGRPNSDGITPASPHSSRPAGGDVPREGSPAVTPQPEHVAVPQPRSGYRRTSPDTAELHGTSLVLLEVPESGGRLTGPLLSALSSVAPHAVHETGVDSLSAFTAWLAQRVTDDDVTDSTSPQVDSERAIPLRLLVDAGVALTEGQRTHAVLVGNALRGSEVTLTPANRARLLLLDPSYAREQRTIAEFMALLLPVVAARELGVRIALVNRRGDVLYFGRPHASHRGHGSHDGEPVAVVVEDDDRYLAGLSAP